MADSFTCPRCGAISHHPEDVREGYCGHCHDWTADDEVLVVCTPVSSGMAPIDGSERLMASCGHEVWAAPSTRQVLALGVGTLFCVDCSLRETRA